MPLSPCEDGHDLPASAEVGAPSAHPQACYKCNTAPDTARSMADASEQVVARLRPVIWCEALHAEARKSCSSWKAGVLIRHRKEDGYAPHTRHCRRRHDFH